MCASSPLSLSLPQGNSADEKSTVSKADLFAMLGEQYELNIDLGDLKSDTVTKADVAILLGVDPATVKK